MTLSISAHPDGALVPPGRVARFHRDLDSILDMRDPRYRSEYSALQATALAAVNRGWTYADWTGYLDAHPSTTVVANAVDSKYAGKGRYHRRKAHARSRLLRGTWERAEERYLMAPPTRRDLGTDLSDLRAVISADTWTGRGGLADRAVITAAVTIADRLGSTVVALATRDLADTAGTSQATAARALHRLRARGYVSPVESAHDSHAARWRIHVPRDRRHLIPDSVTPHGATDLSDSQGHRPLAGWESESLTSLAGDDLDAFTGTGRQGQRGLGRAAATVMTALTTEPVTTAELARAVGITPRTARAALHALAAAGVITGTRGHRGYVWTLTEPVNLTDLARDLGTEGSHRRRRLAHEVQRRGWAEYRQANPTGKALTRQERIDRAMTRRRAAA